MDDGFLNWGFMPSTSGYVLTKANSEYAHLDTSLLKAGSFEEVYPEFVSQVLKTHNDWFLDMSQDVMGEELRNTFRNDEALMSDFLKDTPLLQVEKIINPTAPPIGHKNAEEPIWVSFQGWDWDLAIAFTFKVRGPYIQPMKKVKYVDGEWVRAADGNRSIPSEDGETYDSVKKYAPLCSYWAEDSLDEYYGTNIMLMKLET